MEKLKMRTELLSAGNRLPKEARGMEEQPLYRSTVFETEDTGDYDRANCGERYLYDRIEAPNRDCLGQAVSMLERGEDTAVFGAGMGAISAVFLALNRRGSHVVVNRAVYGETIEFLNDVLTGYGVDVSYVDFEAPEEVERAITERTTLVYTEVLTNPLLRVVDLDAVVKLARRRGVLTVVDSTFTTPFLIRPLEHGADLVIHSLTKYFGGHSDITGGSVTGSRELVKKVRRTQVLLGSCMAPDSAWLALRSLRTMDLRVRRQMENAAAIAGALEADSRVRYVNYPGLASHPQHELATRLLDGGYGAMLSFRVEDDLGKVDEMIHRLKVIRYLGTLGGIRPSLAHPATAFRHEFSCEELEAVGIYDGLIRISAGIEDAEDLIQDLRWALEVFGA